MARQLQGRYDIATRLPDQPSMPQLEQFLRCMDPAITTDEHRLNEKAYWLRKLKISSSDSNFPARVVLKQLLSDDDRVREHTRLRCVDATDLHFVLGRSDVRGHAGRGCNSCHHSGRCGRARACGNAACPTTTYYGWTSQLGVRC